MRHSIMYAMQNSHPRQGKGLTALSSSPYVPYPLTPEDCLPTHVLYLLQFQSVQLVRCHFPSSGFPFYWNTSIELSSQIIEQ